MSNASIRAIDPEIADLISAEAERQTRTLRLIPSENYVSSAVLAASGTCLTNKYSEGYAGRRYYQGQQHIDSIERIAVSRACELFAAEHANVQPYSGSPANLAAYTAVLEPGDCVLGMSLPHGGHLTHGWSVSITGKHFRAVQYGVDTDNHRIDFDEVAALAREHQPKLIICGATAYPRIIDFERFAEIAHDVGAVLLADIAHIAGLVVGGVHPSPIPHADIVTTTTHKTLRGPRGGMILCRKGFARRVDRAVFPGLQGGPHNSTTAAIAVALREAATPEFKDYAHRIVANAKALADGLLSRGFDLVTGGTDNHQLIIDLTAKGVPGKIAAQTLEHAGIVCNANTVPFDPRKPFDPSGIRLGTPALASRGMGVDEMARLAVWIDESLSAIDDDAKQMTIADDVAALCAAFPAPGL